MRYSCFPIVLVCFKLLAQSNSAYAEDSDSDFNLPSVCRKGATGAPSSNLATQGNPPAVQVSYGALGHRRTYVDEISISQGMDKAWYIDFKTPFNAPPSTYYEIRTAYTPFLTTYQTTTRDPGESVRGFELAPPKGTKIISIKEEYTIKVGENYAGYDIEFDQGYEGSDPFTMHLDDKGSVIVYCYMEYSNTRHYHVTVYKLDQLNSFVNTGVVDANGNVIFDK